MAISPKKVIIKIEYTNDSIEIKKPECDPTGHNADVIMNGTCFECGGHNEIYKLK